MKFSSSAVICALLGSLAFVGCGENYDLTENPVSVDIYVDSTYSNNGVDLECMDDVMEAAKLVAGSRGYLQFHTFDGDPFHSRGLNESFSSVVLPGGVEGTEAETAHLEEQAEKLKPRMRRMIEEDAVVPETPLIQLFKRAARHTASADSVNHILICTDGLFTDVNPKEMTRDEAVAVGRDLPPTLHGVVVDFIGLDGSQPERGEYIEKTRPLVRGLLTGAGAQLGAWELELPPGWRDSLIAAANPGNA